MASFEERILGLTQIEESAFSASTTPTDSQVDEFLKDGVMDVTNRCIAIKPEDASLFADVTDLAVAQGLNLNGAKIITVLRADGVTAGNFRSCRKIPFNLEYLVTDEESLHYASKFNPAYLETPDGKINVYPAPADDSGKDSFKVYYVNNAPQNNSGAALSHAHDEIKFFPMDKIYLVVIYAAMQSIRAVMANMTEATAYPDIQAVIPKPPSDALISDPTVTAGTVAWGSDAAGTGSNDMEALTDAPSYTDVKTDRDDADLVQTTSGAGIDQADFDTAFDDEDPELMSALASSYGAIIGERQLRVQNNLNAFNEEATKYQADLQVKIENRKNLLQGLLKDAETTTSASSKDAELKLQKAIQNQTLILQKYANQVQSYTSEVNAEVQAFQGLIAATNSEMQWYAGQYNSLKVEYDEAFQIMMPPQKRQPQERKR